MPITLALKQKDRPESKASLDYMVTFRLACASDAGSVSKKKRNK